MCNGFFIYLCIRIISNFTNVFYMTIEIKQTDGKWLINGKMFTECNYTEQRFFIEFLNSFRYDE